MIEWWLIGEKEDESLLREDIVYCDFIAHLNVKGRRRSKNAYPSSSCEVEKKKNTYPSSSSLLWLLKPPLGANTGSDTIPSALHTLRDEGPDSASTWQNIWLLKLEVLGNHYQMYNSLWKVYLDDVHKRQPPIHFITCHQIVKLCTNMSWKRIQMIFNLRREKRFREGIHKFI